ncbi:DNA-3-methyladenine glycosylase I [Parvularcula bermudensis HTCC2503]|uniref:DNA-3-methyladenine glycosylase I n=1 Tax=Parvularcula bermudensis (strain ATCC BAA-594 / HTCC2503 / KCTC 12087) TaxID=314260 RepID=E0TCJ3_PARBH|nr:DNA-3-methyladenine glycosylase I [Parvularcula bermudensis]ADM08582.1 DNA-3-methyladenine glycosylase I [Parvularcula bermudensis HTCC2503]
MTGRCTWVPETDPVYVAYHDEEWGVPEWDSRALYEKLILDGFQAGLSWRTILYKRPAFREAFEGFDPERIAAWESRQVDTLLGNPGIVRHRGKIEAAIVNARAWLALEEEGAGAVAHLWSFFGGKPVQNQWAEGEDVPATSPAGTALSKDLKARGFKFCGPTIVYAFAQAVGMVNDHLTTCPRHAPVAALAARSPSPSR